MTCNLRLRKNFMKHEFGCHCCGRVIQNNDFLDKLQALRDILSVPVFVVSGTRCEKHNKKVGGAKASYHMYGRAGDVKAKGKSVDDIAKAAKRAGFKGVITYRGSGFVHCDNRARKYYAEG